MFLEISQNLQEKSCARVSFLLKKRLWYRCFPMNFAKFPRTPFLTEHLGSLLLNIYCAVHAFAITSWNSHLLFCNFFDCCLVAACQQYTPHKKWRENQRELQSNADRWSSASLWAYSKEYWFGRAAFNVSTID